MLKRVTVKGFTSFDDTSADLDAMNVLIGPNGGGKSNLLMFLRMMGFVVTGALQTFVGTCGGASAVLRYGPKRTTRIIGEVSIQDDSGMNDYCIELAHGAGDTLFIADERIRYTPDGHTAGEFRSLERPGQRESALTDEEIVDKDSTARVTRALLRKIRTFQFHDTSDTAKLKQSGYIGDNKYLRDDAGNLAAFLYALMSASPREYGLIRDTVRTVAPFFDDFVLEPSALNEERIKLEWRSKHSTETLSANQLSDGTLRFIALTTLLRQPNPPDVICIDEPELGLHPMAINTLVDMAYEMSPNVQIILATQSVPLVDAVEPGDILTVEQVRGATRITRLDAESLHEWLAEYRVSDLWERNILGGRPQP